VEEAEDLKRLFTPPVFIKFDKIRSFLFFWGNFSFAQRRRPEGFLFMEKGTLVSGAARNAGACVARGVASEG
jgi:hypothetical protein